MSLFRRQLIARWLKLPPAQYTVAVERNIPIPLTDGTALFADHYIPKSDESFPTILIRSPWGRGWEKAPFSLLYMFLSQRFAERGYHVVLQDMRDTSNAADGGWFVSEAQDGRTTLDWIGRQPWFNGSLGMWGASILGYVQWAVAADAPSFLKALVPITTASQWYTLVFPDGAFALDTMLRLASTLNVAGKSVRELIVGAKQRELALAAAFQHLPIGQADVIALGKPDPTYRNWFAQSHRDDPFWQASDHSAGVPRVTAATHLIAGWHDIFLTGQLEEYAALHAAGRSPYLTVGPWHHTEPEFESVREGITWFDAQLKGDRRRLRKQPVRVYVMGVGEWREFASWPPPAHEIIYSLHAQGQLLDQPPAAGAPPDQYRYDPSDPTPSIGGPLLDAKAAGQQDNRTLEARSDVVCYTTSPLAADLEVIGHVRLELYVQSSGMYTDFLGRVCDVYPDGRSLNVCDGLLRIEPGKGQRQPDGSLYIHIELRPTAYRFAAGHCIRLQVSSGAHPRWSRNLGTGEPLGAGARLVVAEQTVYHDRLHPSALALPIIWE